MKIFKRITISIIVLLVIVISIVFSNTYLRRYALLNFPDVYDYKHLPYRIIENDNTAVFHFDKQPDFDITRILPINFHGRTINNLEDFLEKHFTTAFIIVKNDSILYEKYFNGHERDTFCKSFSASKNFIAALIGIAYLEEIRLDCKDERIESGSDLQTQSHKSLAIKHC